MMSLIGRLTLSKGERVDRHCMDLLQARWAAGYDVCVGLDPDPTRMQTQFRHRVGNDAAQALLFLREIVKATADLVAAYKPNQAFFEGMGLAGLQALVDIIDLIHHYAPEVPVLLDFKRADVGHTSVMMAKWAFDEVQADAVTVNPYLGQDAVQPFLDRADRGVFVLCRTSNRGSGEFQTLETLPAHLNYIRVAERVAKSWNTHGNCGLVFGATTLDELRLFRNGIGSSLPLLIPGVGAQGADVYHTALAGMDSTGHGMLINASRSVLHASPGEDFAQAARREVLRMQLEIDRARVDRQ